MSGPMCPDCGQWDFKRKEAGPCFGSLKSPYDQCQFCGWIGRVEDLGRKMPTQETLEHLSMDRDLKSRGKLFFVRVYLKNDASDDVDFEILDILNANGASSSASARMPGFKIRLDSRPSEELLAKARSVEGVDRVEVW